MNKSQELEESHEVNVLQTTKRELQYFFTFCSGESLRNIFPIFVLLMMVSIREKGGQVWGGGLLTVKK